MHELLAYLDANLAGIRLDRAYPDPRVDRCWRVDGLLHGRKTSLLVYLDGHPLGPDHEEVLDTAGLVPLDGWEVEDVDRFTSVVRRRD